MSSPYLKSLDGSQLKDQCTKFAERFSRRYLCDVEVNDLIFILSIMQFTLPDRRMYAMENLEFIRETFKYYAVDFACEITFSKIKLFTLHLGMQEEKFRVRYRQYDCYMNIFTVYNLSV
jgi:hypothetical protein